MVMLMIPETKIRDLWDAPGPILHLFTCTRAHENAPIPKTDTKQCVQQGFNDVLKFQGRTFLSFFFFFLK